MTTHPIPQQLQWKILGLAAMLAYGGMLFEHACRLWSHDYFRFFPLFLLAVGGIAIRRVRSAVLPEEGDWKIEPVSFGLSLLLLGIAVWVPSPWLAAVSFLLLGDSLLCDMRSARSSWRLLLLLIPLPLGLDGRLIQKLQLISSLRAGQILDVIGVPHLMRGNILELADRRFFVAEACSGISSIYLMTAATAMYVVLTSMRMVRAVPLLLSVLWWAIVANALRIVAIAATHHFFRLDLSQGWMHETLGVALMLLAFLGIWSTRSLLDFFFGPIDDDFFGTDETTVGLTPAILWNIVTTPDLSRVYPEDRGSHSVVSRHAMLVMLSVVLLICGGVYWGTLARTTLFSPESAGPLADVSETAERAHRRFHQLDEDAFQSVTTIAVRDFQQTTRHSQEQRNLWGAYSKTWQVRTPSGDAAVSVDGPFDGWHELKNCYEGQGWKFEQTSVHAIPGQPPGRNLVTVRMLDVDGKRAHLHFSLMRPTGSLLAIPPEASAEGIFRHFRERIRDSAVVGDGGETWQLQLLTQVHGQSLDSEIRAQQFLFGQLLQVLQNHWKHVEQQESSTAGRLPESRETPAKSGGTDMAVDATDSPQDNAGDTP